MDDTDNVVLNPEVDHVTRDSEVVPDSPMTNEQQLQPPAEPQVPFTPPPLVQTSSGPYADSDEHLWHLLSWADHLVRAQTVRWQHTIGSSKLEQFWGMVHVTDAEVNTYLATQFMRPDELPVQIIEAMQPYWDAAHTIAENIEQRCQQTPREVTLRLKELEKLFSLSSLEIAVLLVCLLPELDGRYRRLFAYLQDDASRMRPSVELVLQILQPVELEGELSRTIFNETAPLRAHHLIYLTDTIGTNEPLSARALHIDTRIVDYLLGSDQLDSQLNNIVSEPETIMDWQELVVDESLLSNLRALTQWIDKETPKPSFPCLFFRGPRGGCKCQAARLMSGSLRIPLFVVDTANALRAPQGWTQTVEIVFREAVLRNAALFWTDTQILRAPDKSHDEWNYLVTAAERHSSLVFFASETPWEPSGSFQHKPFIRIDFPVPGYELRKRLWEVHLPMTGTIPQTSLEREQLVELLANGFQLTGGQIADALTTAQSEALRRDPQHVQLTMDDIYEGCRRQSSRGLITFAQLIEPRSGLTFEQLILPKTNRKQLDELRARIRYRSQVYTSMGFEQRLTLGKGLIAIFAGSSGTGKTMAAELLAQEYGMQLYKVDLSAVVSKYVGETEKNLAKVFNQAEDANAILLFDEGESLFGKRGEVKEARDRWANIEASFLLQRVEEYRGVVIVTTNRRQDIEPAFWRRIDMVVEFPRPDTEARYNIWRGMFPEGVNRPSDEQLSSLAQQFTLSGGNIKNAAVDAAFRAVAQTTPLGPKITMRHLIHGIAREQQKTGKSLTKGDFGEKYFNYLETDIL